MKNNDALCLLHTYHFADLAIFDKYKLSLREAQDMLRTKGYEPNDGKEIDQAYVELVEELAQEILPEGWAPTYNYWGGKCYSFQPGWNAPRRNLLMDGENTRYLCSTSEQAIREELNRFSEMQKETGNSPK